MMPDYLISIGLYKYNHGDLLYNVWDIKGGKMLIYSKGAILRYYMELMDET